MLDKRLVEFALGIPPSYNCRKIDRRRTLFRQAVGELLPTSADWQLVKTEHATFAALEKEHIQAYSEWDRSPLASEKTASAATAFVDAARIRRAIQSARQIGETKGSVRCSRGLWLLRHQRPAH